MVDTTLRLMTANLYNGRAAIGSLRRVLQKEQPAVAVFQEMDPAQARIIEHHFGYGRLDPRRDCQGMGIAATHPIEVERFPMTFRDGWRGLLRASQWPQLVRDVEVLNVHLMNPLKRPWRATARLRDAQVDDILEYVAAKRMARIVLGDMNASPAWGIYKGLAARLQDAATAADTAAATWSYRPWMRRTLRIDHAFVEGLVPVATRTVRIRRSDHSALIVDLYVE